MGRYIVLDKAVVKERCIIIGITLAMHFLMDIGYIFINSTSLGALPRFQMNENWPSLLYEEGFSWHSLYPNDCIWSQIISMAIVLIVTFFLFKFLVEKKIIENWKVAKRIILIGIVKIIFMTLFLYYELFFIILKLPPQQHGGLIRTIEGREIVLLWVFTIISIAVSCCSKIKRYN